MKTKLLLILLSLIVSSLSYGLSTSFRVSYDYEKQVAQIAITSSKMLSSGKAYDYVLKFDCRSDVRIYKADNKNYDMIKGIISNHFTKHTQWFDNKVSLSVGEFCAVLQKVAIWNDYMITHVSMDFGDSAEGRLEYDLLIYKPE
jgi:hypothetical protein